MSDSELSDAPPVVDDHLIEQRLQRVVREALKHDEQISPNQARAKAEAELGLEAGFFKTGEWKSRSKDIISAAVEEPPSPKLPIKSASTQAIKAGAKRKSTEPHTQQKRSKKVANESEESEAVLSEGSEEGSKGKAVKKQRGRRRKAADTDESDPDVEDDEARADAVNGEGDSSLSEPPKTSAEPEGQAANGKVEDDSSDFSSVIDEPMQKKKRQKKTSSPATAKGAKTKIKQAGKPKAAVKDLSSDEEEIKRLQSWLVKCGIRKVWGKELKKFDTPKEKIRHLKKMLEDVGMTGRYSAEKAKQIKESRELAAELAEAQAFNETWGHDADEGSNAEDGEEPKPKRRLKPKGLVDFGDSGDDGSD